MLPDADNGRQRTTSASPRSASTTPPIPIDGGGTEVVWGCMLGWVGGLPGASSCLRVTHPGMFLGRHVWWVFVKFWMDWLYFSSHLTMRPSPTRMMTSPPHWQLHRRTVALTAPKAHADVNVLLFGNIGDESSKPTETFTFRNLQFLLKACTKANLETSTLQNPVTLITFHTFSRRSTGLGAWWRRTRTSPLMKVTFLNEFVYPFPS